MGGNPNLKHNYKQHKYHIHAKAEQSEWLGRVLLGAPAALHRTTYEGCSQQACYMSLVRSRSWRRPWCLCGSGAAGAGGHALGMRWMLSWLLAAFVPAGCANALPSLVIDVVRAAVL